MTTREWCPVPEWEGLYEVSNDGLVRVLPKTVVVPNAYGKRSVVRREAKVLAPYPDNTGRGRVALRDGDHRRSYYVHDLVAMAFGVTHD